MNFIENNWVSTTLILGLFSLLVFILSIPGTMALRNVSAFILLISLVVICYKERKNTISIIKDVSFKNIILILVALTLYIFVHSFFFSHEFNWSIGEYKSHWIYPMLYFIIGVLLAVFSQVRGAVNREILVTYLFFAMFLHVLYIDMVALDRFMQSGNLISRYGGINNSPIVSNYITNILIAMIAAEAVYRVRVKKKMLKISNGVLFFIFIVCIYSSIIESMRFGSVALLFLGISTIFIFLFNNQHYSKKTKISLSILLFFVSLAPLAYSITTDSRWNSLVETIPIALDTESNQFWKSEQYDVPNLSNGSPVSVSNYWRIAWAKKSIDYIIKEPNGIGYGRNAFGHAIQMYELEESARGKHAHSSILDFTVGVGLVGLGLWLAFIVSIFVVSIKYFLTNTNYFSIVYKTPTI